MTVAPDIDAFIPPYEPGESRNDAGRAASARSYLEALRSHLAELHGSGASGRRRERGALRRHRPADPASLRPRRGPILRRARKPGRPRRGAWQWGGMHDASCRWAPISTSW